MMLNHLGEYGVDRVLTIGELQDRSPTQGEVTEEGGIAILLPSVKDGCAVSPTCFECPLPDCMVGYQGKTNNDRMRRMLRDNAIAEKHQGGASVAELAREYRLDRRRIRRIIAVMGAEQ